VSAVSYAVDDDPELGQLALFTGGEPAGVQLSLFPDLVPPAPIYPDRTPAEWLDACRATLDASRARMAGQLSLDEVVA
jgi:hypothetical protein